MAKAWDIRGYACDGMLYCADCMEKYLADHNLTEEEAEASPIFESDEAPASGETCGMCSEYISEPYNESDIDDAIEGNLEPSDTVGTKRSGFGWYGLYLDITRQELRDIGLYGEAENVGTGRSYIIHRDSQGFRHLVDSGDVDKEWDEIQNDYASYLAEG